MNKRVLTAKENMIYTNGEFYGRIIYLADNQDGSSWYEITKEEYNEIMKNIDEQIEENM